MTKPAGSRDGTQRDLYLLVTVQTHVALGVHGGLLWVGAGVGDFDDMLQLPGLLLDLRCQEQRRLGNDLRGKKGGRGEEKKKKKKPFQPSLLVNMASECLGAAILTFLWNFVKEWII